MRKFLPYIPLAIMLVGVTTLQFNTSHTGLLSNTLETTPIENTAPLCTKPENFIEKNAWCREGIASKIQENEGHWSWKCIKGAQEESCHFSETKNLKTRPGMLFHP